jgi:hypothetical protein
VLANTRSPGSDPGGKVLTKARLPVVPAYHSVRIFKLKL